MACIAPPGVVHINTVLGTAFRSSQRLLDYHVMTLALPVDYRVKSTGMGHANTSLIDQLPVLGGVSKGHRVAMHIRGLMLNCLHSLMRIYGGSVGEKSFRAETWTRRPRLLAGFFTH